MYPIEHFIDDSKRASTVSAKGPTWLSTIPAKSRSTLVPNPTKVGTATSTAKAASLHRRGSATVAPASPDDKAAAAATTEWEAEAIEHELPSVPGVRHYYPAWDAGRQSVRCLPPTPTLCR